MSLKNAIFSICNVHLVYLHTSNFLSATLFLTHMAANSFSIGSHPRNFCFCPSFLGRFASGTRAAATHLSSITCQVPLMVRCIGSWFLFAFLLKIKLVAVKIFKGSWNLTPPEPSINIYIVHWALHEYGIAGKSVKAYMSYIMTRDIQLKIRRPGN